MAKQQANVNLSAPGFFGIDTEDNPATLSTSYAKIADNVVVDDRGRMASRHGCPYVTTAGGTGSNIKQIYEFVDDVGTTTVFSCGNGKIYSGTETLVDLTPTITPAPTITSDNWQIVQLNGLVHFFRGGAEPLVYDNGTFTSHSTHSAATGTPPQTNAVCSGFGRLFTGGSNLDPSTVYWSDLLLGTSWSGGSSGSIDLQNFWPTGYDLITGLAVHNGFLIVFGQTSILLFAGADTPSTMVLQDSIAGIGCIARDSIVTTGDDVMFLDRGGYRSLGRTVQEKSSPLGLVSRNVTKSLLNSVSDTSTIRAAYDSSEANIILSCPEFSTVWVFDTLLPTESGAYRTTNWRIKLDAVSFTDSGQLLFGAEDGILKYTEDSTDFNGTSYEMRYYSWYQDFGDPVTIKMPKGADITSEGGSGVLLKFVWAFDYKDDYKTKFIQLPTYTISEYGDGEFGEADFGGAAAATSESHFNMTGTGRSVSVGIEATIDGDSLAVQEMNVHSIVGRLR
jgi:hypothetical protein